MKSISKPPLLPEHPQLPRPCQKKKNTSGCHNAVPQVSLTQLQPLNVFGDFQKRSKGQGKFNSAHLSVRKKKKLTPKIILEKGMLLHGKSKLLLLLEKYCSIQLE